MKGSIDSTGKVTIVFNIQNGGLAGPDGLFWLPCSHCNRLNLVSENTVAVTCDTCQDVYDRDGVYP